MCVRARARAHAMQVVQFGFFGFQLLEIIVVFRLLCQSLSGCSFNLSYIPLQLTELCFYVITGSVINFTKSLDFQEISEKWCQDLKQIPSAFFILINYTVLSLLMTA